MSRTDSHLRDQNESWVGNLHPNLVGAVSGSSIYANERASVIASQPLYRKQWGADESVSYPSPRGFEGVAENPQDSSTPPAFRHQPQVVYYDALEEYLADNERAWHIDWMRFVANWLVVAVHVVTATEALGLRATAVEHHTLRAFLVNLLQIGMPIFFYASGRAAAYSSERNILKFAWKKTVRLIFPLIVGYVLILGPAAFISEPFYLCRTADTPPSSPGNFFRFMRWYFRNFTNCGVEWLWFLPALWGLAVVSFPFTLFVTTLHVMLAPSECLSQKDVALKHRLTEKYLPKNEVDLRNVDMTKIKRRAVWHAVLLFSVVTAMIFVALLAVGTAWLRMSVRHIFIYTLPFILAALVPNCLLPICRRFQVRAPIFVWLPLGTLLMAVYREDLVASVDNIPEIFARHLTSVAFYCAFYLQGFIEQQFMFEWEKYERLAKSVDGKPTISFLCRPFKVILWVAFMANGVPGLSEHWAYLWTYPVYNDSYASVTYVLGSWISLHFWERFMMMYCRSSFGQLYHRHVVQSSMVVYIVHGLTIAIVARVLIYPLRSDLRMIGGVFLLITFVVPLTIIFYMLIINIPPLKKAFGLGGPWWHGWGSNFKALNQYFANKRRERRRRQSHDDETANCLNRFF